MTHPANTQRKDIMSDPRFYVSISKSAHKPTFEASVSDGDLHIHIYADKTYASAPYLSMDLETARKLIDAMEEALTNNDSL